MKLSKKIVIMGLLIVSIGMTALGCGEKGPADKAGDRNQQPGGNTTEPTR